MLQCVTFYNVSYTISSNIRFSCEKAIHLNNVENDRLFIAEIAIDSSVSLQYRGAIVP